MLPRLVHRPAYPASRSPPRGGPGPLGLRVQRRAEKELDVRSVPWVRRAFRLKKYAFAADYIRHYALYTEGGIYLDTDIEIRKPFDELLTASRLFAVVEVNEEVHARNIEDGLLDREGHLLT